MKLTYSKPDGETKSFALAERPITIGRSEDADVILLDEKVSRVHCGIRYFDGAFYIKDLKSKNGTFVNGARIEAAQLAPADVIKVGSYTFTFEQTGGPGTETALREISDEMDLGKGYSTLLKEIVHDSGDMAAGTPPAVAPAKPAQEDKPMAGASTAAPKPVIKAPMPVRPGLKKLPTRPPLKINIKKTLGE